MVKSSREAVDKWGKNLKGASAEIRAGIDRVEVSPAKLAADNIEKMKIRLMEAFDSGKVERALREVSLEDWKVAFKDKGVPRISEGVNKADTKMLAFMDFLIPHVEAGKSKLAGMPSITLGDNIARMVAFIEHMASKKYKG